MEKVLTIDGREVGFKATALTPRLYRHKVRRDIIQDMNKLRAAYTKAVKGIQMKKPDESASPEERARYDEAVRDAELSIMDLEIFENVAFVMARQYDQTIPDDADEWLDGFGCFSIYEILPEILALWQMNQETTAKPKNV